MSRRNRRYGSASYSSHYDRGYAYTLGRRDAHWRADMRQRRVRYIRGLICGPAGRSMLLVMIVVAMMLSLMAWQGVIPLSTAVIAFVPAVIVVGLLLKAVFFLVEVLSFLGFT